MIYFDVTDQRINYVYEKFKNEKIDCDEFNFEKRKSLKSNDTIVFSPAKKLELSEVLNYPNKISVFCGALEPEVIKNMESKNIKYFNYLQDEIFTIQNALLTSEALLSIMIEKTPRSLFDSKILIIGGGRIAKSLANYLNGLNIKYSFFIFSQKDLFACQYYNQPIILGFENVKDFKDFDLIINTIPKELFNNKNINLFKENSTYIESASIPSVAENSQSYLNFISALKLPQKFSPISAGKLVYNFIKRECDL